MPKTDDKGKRKAAESSGQRPEVQIAHRVAKATGSTEVEIEIPVGVRAVVARMKANGRPWSLAVINQGVGKAGVLRALYELEDRAEGAVIAVFPEDACMEVYGRHLPHPDVLKLCITRFKGLIVDGVLMRKPRKKKPWLDVDWDDPRLNPIVAAITDGRIPPPEEDDPVESFAALVEKRPPIMTEQKRKRFLKSAEKAMPFFSEKHLW